MAYVLAILGLSFLIIVHELGHMWVARLSGMRVETFSVGFGPALLRWRGKRTVYQLALIPLGGYVQITGMNPHEEVDPNDSGSYANKGALAKIATIVAGPLTNYITATLLIVAIGLAWGEPHWQHAVREVVEGSPAARAGMKKGDQIESISGKQTPSIQEVVQGIQASQGKAVPMTVRRGERRVALQVKPEKKKGGEAYLIGIGFARKVAFSDISAGGALLKGLVYPLDQARAGLGAMGQLFGKLFQGDLSGAKQMGGVVEIVYQLSEHFKESVALALIFLAMLSAWLALLNLLPVPALDGGRLLFLLAGVLLRRQINQRVEHMVHTVGFLLLIGVLLLVTYCDVARRMGGP